MSRFSKNPQVQEDKGPFVGPVKMVKGGRQNISAKEFKKLDHSKGPDTDKRLKSKGFKDIHAD